MKTAQDLFELLRSGKADAIAQSREALTGLSARLPGSRVLDGAFLNSFVAIAVPKNKPAALAYVSTFLEEAKMSGSLRRASKIPACRSHCGAAWRETLSASDFPLGRWKAAGRRR